MRHINRIAEYCSQNFSQRGAGTRGVVELLRRLHDERSALRAYRRKHLRMAEGETYSAIAAHGNSADRSIASALRDAVLRFDLGHEFLAKKIAIADAAIGG